MTTPPTEQQYPTETIYLVVRSKLDDYVRRSDWYLDLTDPGLKALNNRYPAGDVDVLERSIEADHLQYCNPDIPLHLMTMWTARGYLCKLRLS
jgi:hypothetical protein